MIKSASCSQFTITCFAAAFLIPSLVAQEHVHPGSGRSAGQPIHPPGTIDGRATPELIPDIVAYRLVLVAFAQPASATQKQKALQRSQLAQFNMSEGEMAGFGSILENFHSGYRALIATQRPSMSNSERAAFFSSRDMIVNNALLRLSSTLSQNAMIRFRAFVLSEKARMTVATLPKMP